MTKPNEPKYRRILLKLSGEALGGEAGVGIREMEVHPPDLEEVFLRLTGRGS